MILEIEFYFSTLQKITVGGFVNQLIKKVLAYKLKLRLGHLTLQDKCACMFKDMQ